MSVLFNSPGGHCKGVQSAPRRITPASAGLFPFSKLRDVSSTTFVHTHLCQRKHEKHDQIDEHVQWLRRQFAVGRNAKVGTVDGIGQRDEGKTRGIRLLLI